jgi:hypothetical protein
MDLREQILGANDRRCVPVECPEWGCTVYVYNMTAKEKNQLLISTMRNKGVVGTDHHARIVYMCACDETGTRIFQEKDIPLIQDRNGEVVERIAIAAQTLNELIDDSQALAEKNSETTQTGSSGTD